MSLVSRRRGDSARGVGPFITWVADARADGRARLHTSRRFRKGLAGVTVSSRDIDPRAAISAFEHEWLRFWAPKRSGWWIAVLFMIGSALFAAGGAQGAWPESPAVRWVDPNLVGWIFFAGSLFFTSAAYLQWIEAINNDVTDADRKARGRPRGWRLFGWRPRNLGYLAAAVQLVGTVLFNLNTGDALIAGLGWKEQDLLIWTPDMMGSICFLVASQAALMEISHHYWSWQPRSLSWWIAAINMLGSVLFMVSAVASFVELGAVVSAPWLANFGTFAGAVCFFIGAYLLIPELFEKQPSRAISGAPA
jgi:hypothetical protein